MPLNPAVVAAASEAVGQPVQLVGPTTQGESRSTFLVTGRSGEWIVKVAPASPGALARQQRLVRLVEGLRDRGYPAPRYAGVGEVAGEVFSVQERLPGQLLGSPPDETVFRRVLPEVLAAVELQRDAGDLPEPTWPTWLLATIETGGEGYCLHDTLRGRADTSALLDRLIGSTARNRSAPVRLTDIVHFDLNPANILHVDGRLAGVVDWNVPFADAAQGDRGFDVATLLFYSYDLDSTRELLWDAAVGISGLPWTVTYLCHLALRQVEWTVRHRPNTGEERRFLRLAHQVLDDCERRGA